MRPERPVAAALPFAALSASGVAIGPAEDAGLANIAVLTKGSAGTVVFRKTLLAAGNAGHAARVAVPVTRRDEHAPREVAS